MGIFDSTYGGWIGKCVGCMLGKPVEGWSFNEISSRLKRLGEYPLRYYFPSKFFTLEELADRRVLVRENIRFVARDDDIDYVVLNLMVLERYGFNFTTLDIGRMWLSKLPYHCTYTAERVAYRNLVLGFKPPLTALVLNPYREWIGARIRADIWGLIAPGKPDLACSLALRDARLSHSGEGIAAALLQATLVSQAYNIKSVEELIEDALNRIPHKYKMWHAVKYVLDLWRKGLDWDKALKTILKAFSHYPTAHSINNTAIEVFALLWSEGDFSRGVTLAVMAGLDTDCNGANVGCILGVLNGFSRIPEEWYKPLNDKVITALAETQVLSIRELAERTMRLLEVGG